MILSEIVTAWPFLEGARIVGAERSENMTWMLRGPGGSYVLRRYRDGYRDSRLIVEELALMEVARDVAGVNVPRSFEAVDGRPFFTACDGLYVVFEYLEGATASHDDLARLAGMVGELAAMLHLAFQGQPRFGPGVTLRWSWDLGAFSEDPPRWGTWQDALGCYTGVHDRAGEVIGTAYELLRERLGSASRAPDFFGMIHADLRAANLIVGSHEKLGLIDFDDSGLSWFLYDAATSLSFFETAPTAYPIIETWLDGYQRVRRVSTGELDLLASLIVYRRLLLVAWLGSHPHANVTGLDRGRFGDDTVVLAMRYLEAPSDYARLLHVERN